METKQAPEAGVLKIEIGKDYRTVAGSKASIKSYRGNGEYIAVHEGDYKGPYEGGGWVHDQNGRLWNPHLVREGEGMHLIALWEEPASGVDLSKREFREGDLVTLRLDQMAANAMNADMSDVVIEEEMIVAVEAAPAFDWKDAKRGMGFCCPLDEMIGNFVGWSNRGEGNMGNEGLALVVLEHPSKTGDKFKYWSCARDLLERSPEHDITPESAGA